MKIKKKKSGNSASSKAEKLLLEITNPKSTDKRSSYSANKEDSSPPAIINFDETDVEPNYVSSKQINATHIVAPPSDGIKTKKKTSNDKKKAQISLSRTNPAKSLSTPIQAAS